MAYRLDLVSVPTWGLFNLTGGGVIETHTEDGLFPSPLGDYLI